MKEKIHVSLESDLVEILKAKAEQEERTFSQQVSYLIKIALRTLGEQRADELLKQEWTPEKWESLPEPDKADDWRTPS
jgi:hypothetical protein